MLLAVVAGCGGGSGGSIVPVRFEITTTTLPDGVLGIAYSATIAVTGGNGAKTFSISAGSLPPFMALNASTGAITGNPGPVPGTVGFTVMVVDSSTPQQSDTQALTIDMVLPLAITTAVLPGAAVGTAYSQAVAATGGTMPYTFSISSGSLPAGLSISAGGTITGTPTVAATSQTFTVSVADSSSPQLTDTQVLSIAVAAPPVVRNDTIADATPLGNGTFAASISPSGHPNTVLAPDEDYYRITTTAASTVTVDINALVNGSPLDSVIEIVNGSGTRLTTCVAPTFTSPCESDDDGTQGVDLDSKLVMQVAGAATFYVHVVDFRGDARPDLLYDIVISGVN